MSWWRRRRDRFPSPFDWIEDEFFGRGFYSDFFREFEESFRRMAEDMNTLFEKARRGELKSPEKGGPFVYGWSFRIGPDGVPHFEEFGNVKGLVSGAKEGLPVGREPLVDVNETDKQIRVTAELPGVDKSDIELETNEDSLVIRVDTEKRKYYKEVDLPAPVNPDSAKATYNNGVLEVVFDKRTPERKGKKIQVQ